MKRENRLRSRADFKRIHHSGKSFTCPQFVLLALPNGLAHSRFGYVVSKKIGNAVQRNKIKRRMREATRQYIANISPGWDFVFIARKMIVNTAYREIENSIMNTLKRGKLYLEPGPQSGRLDEHS